MRGIVDVVMAVGVVVVVILAAFGVVCVVATVCHWIGNRIIGREDGDS